MSRLRSLTLRARVVALLAALVVVAAGVGIALMLRPGAEPAPSASPSPSPSSPPAPSTTARMADVPMAAPERVLIPRVGIDLAVLPDAPVDGVLDPPGVTDAYWIEDYGTPGTDADNTVYLAAHSSLRMDAAFNPLLDVDHQESVLEPGDEVVVVTANGRLTYEVTRSQRYDKNALPAADEVWDVEPGVLHLITCFQQDGLARAADNLVVTATLVDASAQTGSA